MHLEVQARIASRHKDCIKGGNCCIRGKRVCKGYYVEYAMGTYRRQKDVE